MPRNQTLLIALLEESHRLRHVQDVDSESNSLLVRALYDDLEVGERRDQMV